MSVLVAFSATDNHGPSRRYQLNQPDIHSLAGTQPHHERDCLAARAHAKANSTSSKDLLLGTPQVLLGGGFDAYQLARCDEQRNLNFRARLERRRLGRSLRSVALLPQGPVQRALSSAMPCARHTERLAGKVSVPSEPPQGSVSEESRCRGSYHRTAQSRPPRPARMWTVRALVRSRATLPLCCC